MAAFTVIDDINLTFLSKYLYQESDLKEVITDKYLSGLFGFENDFSKLVFLSFSILFLCTLLSLT